MYIRTPKRYRGMQRRQVFSCQRFFLILVLIILIAVGVGIYEMRTMLQPNVLQVVEGGMEQVSVWQSTQFAPIQEPTRDPSSVLIDADNEWEAGRIDFALNSYAEVVNSTPNDSGIYTRLAEGYLTRGNIEDALAYADATVTADPFNADAWATRAFIYSWEEQVAEGISSAQQALALDPNNARATAVLSYAYFQADEFNLATSRAEDAIALNPDLWAGYWARGLVRENIFPIDIQGAQSDFETAYNLARIQNPPMAGVVGAAIARVYVSQGNPNGSVELLNEILSNDSSNREALYYLGITHYTHLGEWGQAQDPFTDCVDIAPDDVSCWYMLGRTLNSLGDQEGAIEAFEEAIERDTPFARHYYWIAAVEIDLGSCNRATPYLEIGYDMVAEGGLPAVEEGNQTLLDAFEFELGTCRISIVPNNPETTAEPEATVEVGDA